MKTIARALLPTAILVALAGCVNTPKGQMLSNNAVAAISMAVEVANVTAMDYEHLPSTNATEKADTIKAVWALNTAWDTVQKEQAAGQPVSLSALNAALATLNTIVVAQEGALPAVTGNTTSG